jgi:excinuclease ABC subunit C
MNYEIRDNGFRIEAYDVAHIAGKNVVGVMTVLENGELNKKEYRMFKISDKNSQGDTNSLCEILERRLGHTDWKMPNLIVVDGGDAQLNTAERLIKEKNFEIPVVAVTKDIHHKAKEIRGTTKGVQDLIKGYEKQILLANNESHRFALNFHRKQRAKSFI